MKRFFVLLAFFAFVGTQLLQAQTKQISGTVTSTEDGLGLPGVSVVVKGTTIGVISDIDGVYELTVPEDAQTLVFSFVGMKSQEMDIGSQTTIDIALEPDVFGLEEVVVTGVSTGTPTKKLGFSVGKVNEQTIQEVPAVDAANALRGKVAGVRIVKPSGNPSANTQIRLRGSTSISGGQSPLIIVDGMITSGNLNDINMEDVKSIEVIKGSAGASLYGSLAGNGVIQIITKRGGTAVGAKDTRITIKNEYGQSFLGSDYPLTEKHFWKVDATGWINDALGNRMQDIEYINPQPTWTSADSGQMINSKLIADNDYWVLNDHVTEVYKPQPFYTNYVSLSSKFQKMNFHASWENKHIGGVIEGLPPYVRRNARVNVDFVPNIKWKLTVSASYNTKDGVGVTERGQGANIFYSCLMAEPHIDFMEKDEDGDYIATFEDYDNNWQNPLYMSHNRRYEQDHGRILGGATLRYSPVDWASFQAEYSLDQTNWNNRTYYPIGYKTPGMNALRFGSLDMSFGKYWAKVAALQADFNKTFADFNVGLTLRYLYEDYFSENLSGGGDKFTSKGVIDLGSVDPDTRSVNSGFNETLAENVFANLKLDYQGKVIFDGLIRRDGSSRFGEDERYQTYFRSSVAYIFTEDFTIPAIDFGKFRVSYGTSGQRPGFSAQYETYSVGASGISPNVLGNKDLKPSTVEAFEIGLNLGFLNSYTFEFNYESSKAKNQFLAVPLSKVAGYTSQWQNAGTMETSALEFSLGGTPVKAGDLRWDFDITWDHITQKITDLGRPAWTQGTAAVAIFRVEEDVPYGTMYGNILIEAINELNLDDDGYVMNDPQYSPNYDPTDPVYDPLDPTYNPYANKNHVPADFKVNEDGYVILTETENTRAEKVLFEVDEDGVPVVDKIGDSNPDFNFGFSNTFSFKGLSLYVLLEGQKGGDIYNYTRQLMNFNNRHGDFETYAEMGKSVEYHNGSSAMYNKADPNSYYVEDGGYIKVREVALAYTIRGSSLGMSFLEDVKIHASGTNLLTFTKYTGFDPEVSFSGNATNFRVDEYAYPNFKTWTVGLTLRF